MLPLTDVVGGANTMSDVSQSQVHSASIASNSSLSNPSSSASTLDLNEHGEGGQPVFTKGLKLEQDLEALSAASLPPSETRRHASLRFQILTIYRRLFSLVFIGNAIAFIIVMVRDQKLLDFVNASAANLLALGLARQPVVVNGMFMVICSVPRSTPLPLRRWIAKLYHYGGVHSGAGSASLIWYLGFVGLLSWSYRNPSAASAPLISISVMALSYLILALLLAIIIVAYPAFRFKRHDYFELTHRFSGWLVLILFWALLILFGKNAARASNETLGHFLIELPAFWMVIITTIAIIQPWLFLRRVHVTPEYISSHAVRLHFTHTNIDFGQGFSISKHPLKDWHGFATFPDLDKDGNKQGQKFSCLVSKAGNWTADCIATQPTRLWKRGVPTYGFGYAMRVFRSLILVTTGSGIGPCLSWLGDENRPRMRVVWQTRAPLKTYGQGVLDAVARLDPDAVILDTDKHGRQDMRPQVEQLVKEFEAEAVCVISNPFVTKKLVFELEARGVPAYGPIFDS